MAANSNLALATAIFDPIMSSSKWTLFKNVGPYDALTPGRYEGIAEVDEDKRKHYPVLDQLVPAFRGEFRPQRLGTGKGEKDSEQLTKEHGPDVIFNNWTALHEVRTVTNDLYKAARKRFDEQLTASKKRSHEQNDVLQFLNPGDELGSVDDRLAFAEWVADDIEADVVAAVKGAEDMRLKTTRLDRNGAATAVDPLPMVVLYDACLDGGCDKFAATILAVCFVSFRQITRRHSRCQVLICSPLFSLRPLLRSEERTRRRQWNRVVFSF